MGLNKLSPGETNVNLEDFLVLTSKKTGFPEAFPILKRGSHYVVARDDSKKERTIHYVKNENCIL